VIVINSWSFKPTTLSGGVLKCALNLTDISSRRRAARDGGQADAPPTLGMGCKVTQAFEAHAGPVSGLSCNPADSKVFATSGFDSELRIYTATRARPCAWLEPSTGYLQCVAWSFHRPMVVACADAHGKVHVYDLAKDRVSPAASLLLHEGDDTAAVGGAEEPWGRRPALALAFNQAFSELLAAGDATGRVRVWQLSSALTDAVVGEADMLAKLASTI